MANNHLTDPKLWKKKARAFVTRSHRHLWGKNNEDPLVFLFQQDLANQFVKKMHLGWNKHGQERTLEKWGLGSSGLEVKHPVNKLSLPPGIVFPYIVEKELVSLWIHPLAPSAPTFLVPGSSTDAILLGDPKNPVKTVEGLFNGLRLFQEKNKTLCIRILPRLLRDPDLY
jgi:hypothetical protein